VALLPLVRPARLQRVAGNARNHGRASDAYELGPPAADSDGSSDSAAGIGLVDVSSPQCARDGLAHRLDEVFDFLSGELQVEFDELDSIVGRDAAAFNELLREKGLPPIAC
jgi:hypothetical protein